MGGSRNNRSPGYMENSKERLKNSSIELRYRVDQHDLSSHKNSSRKLDGVFESHEDKRTYKIDHLQPVLRKYNDNLQKIFMYYCQFGEPMQSYHMGSSKFIKLLRDAEVIRGKGEIASPGFSDYD
jgi:hypothetical protein